MRLARHISMCAGSVKALIANIQAKSMGPLFHKKIVSLGESMKMYCKPLLLGTWYRL